MAMGNITWTKRLGPYDTLNEFVSNESGGNSRHIFSYHYVIRTEFEDSFDETVNTVECVTVGNAEYEGRPWLLDRLPLCHRFHQPTLQDLMRHISEHC